MSRVLSFLNSTAVGCDRKQGGIHFIGGNPRRIPEAINEEKRIGRRVGENVQCGSGAREPCNHCRENGRRPWKIGRPDSRSWGRLATPTGGRFLRRGLPAAAQSLVELDHGD